VRLPFAVDWARLDRMVETRAREGEEMLAQIVAGDWPGFLALFDTFDVLAPDGAGPDAQDAEGYGAALALWLAGRDNRANPLATLWCGTAIANEVAQISAVSDEAPADEPTPEEEAAAMTVWHDEENHEWRTNFPPPDDFAGIEEGRFGDDDYERTLDLDEEIALDAAFAQAVAPLRRAGEAARRAFFALPAPANDAAPKGEKVRKNASG
jgi:hypothetical protein